MWTREISLEASIALLKEIVQYSYRGVMVSKNFAIKSCESSYPLISIEWQVELHGDHPSNSHLISPWENLNQDSWQLFEDFLVESTLLGNEALGTVSWEKKGVRFWSKKNSLFLPNWLSSLEFQHWKKVVKVVQIGGRGFFSQNPPLVFQSLTFELGGGRVRQTFPSES